MDRTSYALAGLLAGALSSMAAAAGLEDPALARSLEASRRDASRMLADPRCLDVLSAFTLPEGGTPVERLERRQSSPRDFLQSLEFVGDEMSNGCRAGAYAHTHRGSARIVVCRRFVSLSRESPAGASHVLIHEMLHALGIGENPPSSREITWVVAHRCGT